MKAEEEQNKYKKFIKKDFINVITPNISFP